MLPSAQTNEEYTTHDMDLLYYYLRKLIYKRGMAHSFLLLLLLLLCTS